MGSASRIHDINVGAATSRGDVFLTSNANGSSGVAGPPEQRATLFMICFGLWISFSAWIADFDSGYQGVVLIMPSFNKAFGTCTMVPDPATGSSIEVCMLSATRQSLTGLSSLFLALGSVLAGFTGHYIGRRGIIQCASAIIIIGAAGMLGTTGNFVNYMVCKCINGVGIGQLLASALVYGTECVSASQRGLILGLYNYGLAMGNVAASAVCAGSSNLSATNDWQWKTPIICQIPLSISLGVGIMMFPESPRWLLMKGREEAARKSFGRFYKKHPDSAEITAQIQSVQEHIELERAASRTASWTEIYHRNHIRRTLGSGICLLGVALTGMNFVAPYAALFLSGLGIRNPYLVNVIIGLCIFSGALIGPFTLEYGGRRFCMLYGYAIMACCMLIFSTVGSGLGSGSPAAQRVLIAFLCIWAFVFGGTAGPAGWLASAELHSVQLRTYGQANTTLFYQIFRFACVFWTPYMLNKDYGNMGTNVGYFYFGITVVWFILVFTIVPETARLTLEQIDDYFTSGRPAWKTSTKLNQEIANDNVSIITGEAKNEIELAHNEHP